MSYLNSINKVSLGLTLVEPGRGGIASVARMTANSLSEAGKTVKVRSFLDKTSTTLAHIPLKSSNGSRVHFMAGLHKDALSCDYFLYDSVGMARAHPRAPFFKRPYGVWIHGVEVWYSLSTARANALKDADFVLVNSAFTLEKFSEMHFVLPNARVCQLATEDESVPEKKADFSGPPTVLMVGRMEKTEMYKGHTEVIMSWKAVKKAVPDAKLIIVGDGSGLPVLQDMVQKLGLTESIEFKGFISGDALKTLWSQATCFAMPSRGEGFGLVYVEAMRHGVPVIASTHDAGQEVNADGYSGFNVNLDQKNALEEKLITLLADLDSAKNMGNNGFKRWHDNFRYANFKDRLLKAIN